jgi:succinate dehydrogenase/fumarate reductase flavoprotein subunit
MTQQDEIDLLVVGSGCGGMATALIAAIRGYKVLLVEKTTHLGGTTAYSSGTAWIPGTHLADGREPADTLADASRYLEWMAQTDSGRELRDAFLASGREAVEFLHKHTDVEFFLPPHGPDYREGPGSAPAGRALVIKEFDGRLLGPDFALLREPRPGFNVLGGMMVGRADLHALLSPLSSWAAFRHASKILWRHAMDRLSWHRGTRLVMGNALVGRLLRDLRKHKVPVLLETRLVELVKEGDRVTAAVLQDGKGVRTVRPRVGVVLATGGFSASAQWRARLMPEGDLAMSVAAPGNSGDGLALAAAADAAIADRDHRSNAFWMPASVYRRGGGEPVLFPHIVLDRAKPGLIAVNAAGKRFVNEAGSYHDFVSAMLETPGMGPGKPAWLVCDASFVWRYGLGIVRPWQPTLRRFVKDGYLLRARTLPELAAQIGADAQGLQQTVARHNEYAGRGDDEDFGRGSTALNRQNGDPRQSPNPCLAPIARAPFYALAVWPADLATSAGLQTDGDARVVDRNGSVIDGLYAVGNDMASIMQGTYPGPGTTLGPAIVFAYRAVNRMRALLPPGGTT